jgi:hypothetical protein
MKTSVMKTSSDMKTRSLALAAVLAALPAVSAAQPVSPAPAPRTPDHAALRRQIYVMEGVLVKAVELGARNLNRELRSALPDLMVLSGEPQARGVYLEGYGVYFDVAVPVLNQMAAMSLRTMFGPDETVVAALGQLKAFAQREKNTATRAALENAIARIELQLGPLSSVASGQELMGGPARSAPAQGAVGAAMVAPGAETTQQSPVAADTLTATPPRPPIDRKYLEDPNALNQAYTQAVQDAIIDAMLDYGVMRIAPHEVLTVAARDNMYRDPLAPQNPYEEIVTILLTIKGSDLAAFRDGQIDAAEARRRIVIREF